MTLPNLANTADLSTRGVTIADEDLADTMLAVASAVVRSAAGSPILEATSTVSIWATDPGVRWLDLPGQPVTAVSAVTVDGAAVDAGDYKLANNRLWSTTPWCSDLEPVEVQVTLTHGLAEVPAHIVNLVCDLAIAGMNTAGEGARTPGVLVESIDDYSVTFAQGAEATASVMELPAGTKRALRKRFGSGASAVAFL